MPAPANMGFVILLSLQYMKERKCCSAANIGCRIFRRHTSLHMKERKCLLLLSPNLPNIFERGWWCSRNIKISSTSIIRDIFKLRWGSDLHPVCVHPHPSPPPTDRPLSRAKTTLCSSSRLLSLSFHELIKVKQNYELPCSSFCIFISVFFSAIVFWV